MAAYQPDAQHREQLVQIDRLGNVIRGAGFDALGAVSLHRLRGHRDDRQRPELGDLPDRAHGFVAVHLRHHDIHQDAIHARRLEQRLDTGAAILGVNHLQIMLLQNAGQAQRYCGHRRPPPAPSCLPA